MGKKWIYAFEDGSEDMRELLGGKGAGLSEMSRLNLPVPPGFTITTAACLQYFEEGEKFPEGLWDEILESLEEVEEKIGRKFGDSNDPLLLSVRSGAKFSMPGMMDTVLNLGLNDETLEGFIKTSGDEHFVYDSYRRLIQMYGDVVLGISLDNFESILEESREKLGVSVDSEITVEELKSICEKFKKVVEKETGKPMPQDPKEQLREAVEAVFASWNTKRARNYRDHHGISHDLGTACNIQTMVFGNMGTDSASGVAFTRNPSTGEAKLYGEYLTNAQGEDVVAGIRTPESVEKMKTEFPEAYDELQRVCDILEDHYLEMQDIEFTLERGKLWVLQTRAGKRTSKAAVVIASDMVKDGIIDRQTALRRVTPEQVEILLHPRFQVDELKKAENEGRMLAKGLNASPGAAVGKVVFDADTAEEWGKDDKVILVRPETTPDDVHGFLKSAGVLTQRGGMTSHAAIVSRGLGIPSVVGCDELQIDLNKKTINAGDQQLKEGDTISIDGSTGKVYKGELPTLVPQIDEEEELLNLLSWADEFRELGVRANADTPEDAKRARSFGATGIGLCRTEHMFFGEDRLPIVRSMILAQNTEERKKALDKLMPMQKEDFLGVFREMDGLGVIIRLIDPPLHEFLPNYEDLIREVAELRAKGSTNGLEDKEKMLEIVEGMHEANPMLGLRGVRLGMLYPEIVEMQVRAIMEAASELKEEGLDPHPEIMIPLVSVKNELSTMRERLVSTAEVVTREKGVDVKYQFGTMIELPRACMVANELAEEAEFFSFGTNDLTQTTYGISRDDAEGRFLAHYVEEGVIPVNPFWSIDREGVGDLMKTAVERGRSTRPDIDLGICGEHGGDPKSIQLCHELGLDYVSCSPFRVPVARLAAARAAIDAQLIDV